MNFFAVFTEHAPTHLFGVPLTQMQSGEVGLLCKSVQSAASGFLELVPEFQPENHEPIALFVHPSHVQCWMQLGSQNDIGFLRVAPPSVP